MFIVIAFIENNMGRGADWITNSCLPAKNRKQQRCEHDTNLKTLHTKREKYCIY